MTKEQKRYIIVFTGLFLMIIGGLIFLNTKSKKDTTNTNSAKAELKILIENNKKEAKPENIFVAYPRPTKLNYIYDENTKFQRTISETRGTITYTGDKYLGNLQVVCGGSNCSRQVVTHKKAIVYDIPTMHRMLAKQAMPKPRTIRGNVVITKGKLDALKPNTKIIGNVYIKNINYIRIPKNFTVNGDIYVINSEGVTFIGNSRVNGQVYVYGKSSIKAIPSSVKISGQILI